MRRAIFFPIIFISIFLIGSCASLEKKRAEFAESSAAGLASCPKKFNFSDSKEGVFFFSFVNNTPVNGEFHWEILNIDTGQRLVFVPQNLVRFSTSGVNLTYGHKIECCFAVPSGKYRVTKIFLTGIEGVITGEKEYFLPAEFEIESLKVTYLGRIRVIDPDNPNPGEDFSIIPLTKGYWKAIGSMFKPPIPKKLQLEVTDECDTDMKWFQNRYNKLKHTDIITFLLNQSNDITKLEYNKLR